MVAQGIQSDRQLNSTIAFNSQKLHEACKAKGVLELHLLQREAAQLKTQYQSSVPPDEMTVRQIQHNQFHVNPNQNIELQYQQYNIVAGKNDQQSQQQQQQQQQLQKPPLQQQLMQHRLLQQKRQILQKQVAMESALSRRQMLRQHSYKIAQQQQILPPLPLNECEDLLTSGFQVNDLNSTAIIGSPKMNKVTHQLPQQALNDCWSTLSGSMQTCQISENSLPHENWALPTHYQVYYMNE